MEIMYGPCPTLNQVQATGAEAGNIRCFANAKMAHTDCYDQYRTFAAEGIPDLDVEREIRVIVLNCHAGRPDS